MLRKTLSWIVLLPIFAVVVSFALSNREVLTLRLWPTDFELTAPMFLIGLGGLFLGFLWGAVTVWMSAGPTRRRARRETARAGAAERDSERLRAEVTALQEKLRAREQAAQADPAQGTGANLPALVDNAATQQPRIL